MVLLKHGQVQPNDWILIGDEEQLPDHGAIIVSVARWQREKLALLSPKRRLGVKIAKDQSVFDLGDLGPLALIVLEFPKFTDGRAFSQARQLRDDLNYRGEIRAVGHILRDQYIFMVRCGIDSVELPADADVKNYQKALSTYSLWYQPASDGSSTIPMRRKERESDR